MGNIEGSGASFDLLTKIRHVNAKHSNGCRGVCLLSATPISNSVAESFTLARYLYADALEAQGLDCFDTFISTYSAASTEYEINATGGFQPATRFRDFTNISELNVFFKNFSDCITHQHLVDMYEANGDIWPSPLLKNNKTDDVVVEQDVDFSVYNDHLIRRSGNIGALDEYKNDNMLSIMTASRVASMDLRLVADEELANASITLNGYESPRTMAVAEKVLDTFSEYELILPNERTAQLVFIDVGTPKESSQVIINKTFSVYHDLRQKLISGGLKPEEIVFIHDAKNSKQRAAIFAKVRTAEIRVLIGSTPKLGAGTNVQDRLIGICSVTQDWKPRNFQQQLGRVCRQGNLFFMRSLDQYKQGLIRKDQLFTVSASRFAMSRSLDAMMIESNQIKANFISKFLSDDGANMRKISLRDEGQVSHAEFKARVSGKPELLLKIKNDAVLRTLYAIEDDYNRRTRYINNQVRYFSSEIPEIHQNITTTATNIQRDRALQSLFADFTLLESTFIKKGRMPTNFKTKEGLMAHICKMVHDASLRGDKSVILKNAHTTLSVICTEHGNIDGFILEVENVTYHFNDAPFSAPEWKDFFLHHNASEVLLDRYRRELESYEKELSNFKSKKTVVFPYAHAIEQAQNNDSLLTLLIEEASVAGNLSTSDIVIPDLKALFGEDTGSDLDDGSFKATIVEAVTYESLLDEPRKDIPKEAKTIQKEPKRLMVSKYSANDSGVQLAFVF